MKKMLILFDGAHFSEAAMTLALQLNDSERILVTGLFLPSIDYTETIYSGGGWAWPIYIPTIDTDPETIRKNIIKFKDYCVKHNIEHRVHDQVDDNLKSVIRLESRYADVVVVDGASYYSNLGELTHEEYLDNVLLKTECPIIVIPENYGGIKSLVMAYDGSPESVFAIKQFAYLLPQLCELPTLVVYASGDDDSIPHLEYMEELCAKHFGDLTFFKLEADAKKYFNTWVANKGMTMVIAGSYATSKLFRKHFVDDVIRDHKLPVFIAHS